MSETCDPRSLGRTSDKIEVSIKLPGSRHKVTQEFGKDLDKIEVSIKLPGSRHKVTKGSRLWDKLRFLVWGQVKEL